MHRLTKRMLDGRVVYSEQKTGYLTALTKLAEYEDTGMTPIEIRELYRVSGEGMEMKLDCRTPFILSLSQMWSEYLGVTLDEVDCAALVALLNILKMKYGELDLEKCKKLIDYAEGGAERV